MKKVRRITAVTIFSTPSTAGSANWVNRHVADSFIKADPTTQAPFDVGYKKAMPLRLKNVADPQFTHSQKAGPAQTINQG